MYSQIKTATILDTATASDEVDLESGYEKLLVVISTTLAQTATIKVGLVSGALATLYTTNKETPAAITIASGVYGMVVEIGGAQFIQIIAGGAVSGDKTVALRGIGT